MSNSDQKTCTASSQMYASCLLLPETASELARIFAVEPWRAAWRAASKIWHVWPELDNAYTCHTRQVMHW